MFTMSNRPSIPAPPQGTRASGRAGRAPLGTRELWSFIAPFAAPVRLRLVRALALGAVSLAAAALIPLQVDSVLANQGNVAVTTLVIAALMALSVTTSSLSHTTSYRASAVVGQSMAQFVYDRTLLSPMLRQHGMRRPSVISRHTSDVDRVQEALDKTVTEGLPGLGRIVVSLALLLHLEPKAGIVTMGATLVFLLLNSHIGRDMLERDKVRLDTSSELGAVVDESITAGRNLTGMNLVDWMSHRFASRADNLRIATEDQKREANRLVTAARVTGYVALLSVVLIALVSGGSEAGAIAAAVLYIEAVVRGLEALPPWLRDVRLALTSKRRIEQITSATQRVNHDSRVETHTDEASLVIRDLALVPGRSLVEGDLPVPRGGVVAVVVDLGVSMNAFLEVLSGDSNPEAGCALLDGIDVRHPTVKRRIMLVTDDPHLMDASVRDHLRAADPHVRPADVERTLTVMGLGHLSQLADGGLDAPLGSHGAALSVHERQRLMIAMAACSSADVIVLQDLPVLADPDGAAPILAELARRPDRTVIVATKNADVAALASHVIAPIGSRILCGAHRDLLERPEYRAAWERQAAGGIDERILAEVPQSQRDVLRARLITEHFNAGETLYRFGSPGDRIIFVMEGRVSLHAPDEFGTEQLIGDVGPGNFCGDVGQSHSTRAETARAVDDTMVRTLSVEAWSAGVLGLLDSDPAERRVLACVLRADDPTLDTLPDLVLGQSHDETAVALRTMIERGQLRVDDQGRLSISARRRSRAGAAAVLDRLVEL